MFEYYMGTLYRRSPTFSFVAFVTYELDLFIVADSAHVVSVLVFTHHSHQ